ncbi:MAG: hypothetical protein J5787_02140 [Alphaproteobacteria bacterium]|nr:hypothetical protein [Alphaproteobacteria bacterium]MBO4643525.1 hypothetical protein [Alphaproteobacteria bacterium]
MYVSDVAEQIVAMQAQMLRNSLALATVKNAAEQQQAVTTLLTEAATNSAAASADGRGAVLDILV